MTSIKRNASSDFERLSTAKKSCVVPPTRDMHTRGIATHVKPPKVSSNVPHSHTMATRRITTRLSTSAVFDTYELLEAILCELPMQKILEVRRVSKSWDAVTKRSKPLRTKLFLDAEPRKSLWVLDRKTLHLRPYEWGAREQLGEEWMHSQAMSRPSIANPLLFTHDAMLRSPIQIRALTCEGLNFTAAPDLAKRRSLVHEMFVTQPPVSVVQFAFYFNATKEPSKPYRRADGCITVKVVKEDGVRFGHILTAFRIEVSRTPEYRLGSKLSIKVHSSSPARKSVVWMLGAVFASDLDVDLVEQFREKAVDKKSSDDPDWVAKVLCLKG